MASKAPSNLAMRLATAAVAVPLILLLLYRGPAWGFFLLAFLRRDMGSDGASYVVMTLMFAWWGDTGGYFAGRYLGKRKLYEAVSPKKTIEGSIGGLAGSVLGALCAHFWYLPSIPLAHAV